MSTFASVIVQRDEDYGYVSPYSLGTKEHKIIIDLGEIIGKLVEKYVEAMEKISGSLFEL